MGVGRFLWSWIAIPGTFNHVYRGGKKNAVLRGWNSITEKAVLAISNHKKKNLQVWKSDSIVEVLRHKAEELRVRLRLRAKSANQKRGPFYKAAHSFPPRQPHLSDHKQFPLRTSLKAPRSLTMAGVSRLACRILPWQRANSFIPSYLPVSTSTSSASCSLRRSWTNPYHSLFFRKNTVMLGTVFVSAFAIQMFVTWLPFGLTE